MECPGCKAGGALHLADHQAVLFFGFRTPGGLQEDTRWLISPLSRPDVNILNPPRKPRMGLWWKPELLHLVPRRVMSRWIASLPKLFNMRSFHFFN